VLIAETCLCGEHTRVMDFGHFYALWDFNRARRTIQLKLQTRRPS